jgi:hypothetical protein
MKFVCFSHRRCFARELGRKLFIYCPICSQVVTQSTLSDKSLDEIEVTRDTKIRKRIKEM